MSAPPHYDEFFAKCRELLSRRRRDAAPHDRPARRGRARPTRSPTNISSPATISRRCRRCAAASEKVRLIASDVETLRLHYAYTLRHWLDRATKAREQDRRDVRRALLPDVGILSRRRDRHVRERRGLQLPDPIYPRPPALPITRDYMAEAEERYRQATAHEINGPTVSRRASRIDGLAGRLARLPLGAHPLVHLHPLFRRQPAVAVGVGACRNGDSAALVASCSDTRPSRLASAMLEHPSAQAP